jgi:hypothetical protein
MNKNQQFDFNELWSSFRKVEQRSLHRFKNELNIIGQQIYTTSLVFEEVDIHFSDNINYQKAWKCHIAKIITSFDGALSTGLRGLFSESANMLRVAIETAWQLIYINKNPSGLEIWLQDKEIKVSTVRMGLNYSDERWEIYKEFCNVSHPRLKGFEKFYTYIEGYVKYGAEFEPTYIEELLYYTHMFLGWIHEDIINQLYPDLFGTRMQNEEIYPKLIQMYLKTREEGNAYFKGERNSS